MVLKCAVLNCKHTDDKRGKYCKLFRFPVEEERSHEWIRLTGQSDLVDVPPEFIHQRRRICRCHFSDHQFEGRLKEKLKKGENPSPDVTPILDEVMSQLKNRSFSKIITTRKLMSTIGPAEESLSALTIDDLVKTKKLQSVSLAPPVLMPPKELEIHITDDEESFNGNSSQVLKNTDAPILDSNILEQESIIGNAILYSKAVTDPPMEPVYDQSPNQEIMLSDLVPSLEEIVPKNLPHISQENHHLSNRVNVCDNDYSGNKKPVSSDVNDSSTTTPIKCPRVSDIPHISSTPKRNLHTYFTRDGPKKYGSMQQFSSQHCIEYEKFGKWMSNQLKLFPHNLATGFIIDTCKNFDNYIFNLAQH